MRKLIGFEVVSCVGNESRRSECLAVIVVCATTKISPHQALCGGGSGGGNNFMDALEPRLICNLLVRRNSTGEREVSE